MPAMSTSTNLIGGPPAREVCEIRWCAGLCKRRHRRRQMWVWGRFNRCRSCGTKGYSEGGEVWPGCEIAHIFRRSDWAFTIVLDYFNIPFFQKKRLSGLRSNFSKTLGYSSGYFTSSSGMQNILSGLCGSPRNPITMNVGIAFS
ncbi:MAG: hypothetical protein C5S49_00180 [Candidatus Methanogaster sp.]|nr:MAG: hypothetical protein C5S49_00180 [ANME-2 cluster archaeon]